jgi:predicted amidohydrolase
VESQTFVLHTTAVISQKGLDKMQCGTGFFGRPGGGSSAVFAPDGHQLSVDIPETEEGVIYVNLVSDMLLLAKSFADATGHYSRPDLLSLAVNTKSKKIVTEVDAN